MHTYIVIHTWSHFVWPFKPVCTDYFSQGLTHLVNTLCLSGHSACCIPGITHMLMLPALSRVCSPNTSYWYTYMNRVYIKIWITFNALYLHDCHRCAVVVKLDSNYQEYIYRLNIYFHYIAKTAYKLPVFALIMYDDDDDNNGIVWSCVWSQFCNGFYFSVSTLQALFMSFIYQWAVALSITNVFFKDFP